MTEELQTFSDERFGMIRTVSIDGEPWFVAVDVCRALDIRTDTIRSILDQDEVTEINPNTIGVTHGRSPLAVSEAGMYSLVLKSRKPEAKSFKRWVTHDVIPSIRRTGGYIAGQEEMTDADLMAKALLVAQRQIEERQHRIESLEQQAALDAPKVLFADAVSAAENSVLVRELAKILKQNGVNLGEKRLFQYLRDNGFLIRRGSDYNLPTQRSMDLGLFEIQEHAVTHASGFVTVTRTPKVTGKGQQYFVRHFLKSDAPAS